MPKGLQDRRVNFRITGKSAWRCGHRAHSRLIGRDENPGRHAGRQENQIAQPGTQPAKRRTRRSLGENQDRHSTKADGQGERVLPKACSRGWSDQPAAGRVGHQPPGRCDGARLAQKTAHSGAGKPITAAQSKVMDMPDPQLIDCPNCRTTNRVPLEKIQQGLQPVCGRCKTPLSVSSKPLVVTDATFSAVVESFTIAGTSRSVGAMVRSLPDGIAGDRCTGYGTGRAGPRGQTECRRQSRDGGALQG